VENLLVREKEIDYSTVRILISLAFGNKWEMFSWDILVAITNTKAEEETYVRFPKSFPERLFPGYKTNARLKRHWYGIQVLFEVLLNLGSNFLLVIHICLNALPMWHDI
jgi:hypothetical protein